MNIRPTPAQQSAWLAQWRSAATALLQVRLDELSHVDLARIADDLEAASIVAARQRVQSQTSGLVTQQAILHRARPR
ncbi:MAG: hypothetical protein ABIR59_03190 [Gemmatimonadales bacterium]